MPWSTSIRRGGVEPRGLFHWNGRACQGYTKVGSLWLLVYQTGLLDYGSWQAETDPVQQRCHLGMIWLTWLGVPLLAVLVGVRAGVAAGVLVLAVGAAAQWAYIKVFPAISRWMGYGSVTDTPPAPTVPAAPLPRVTLYTANVCPFCPIIRRRLVELRRQHPFDLEEVDVTFRPEIVRPKRIRAVPVIEANGRVLVGNATSADILAFLTAAPEPPGDAR